MFCNSVFAATVFATALHAVAAPATAGPTLKTFSVSTTALKLATVNKSKPARVPGVSFTIAPNMKSRMNAMQWTMKAGSDGRPILSGNRYRMVNAVSQAGLKRQARSVAANLGWLSPNSGEFNLRIKRQAGDGQVRYGDVVALEVKSYGWLRNKKQKAGINLSDDNHTPHYIWIVTGGTRGTKLVAGMPFALYNTKQRTEMTYCQRTWGIDLGWNGKSDCGSQFSQISGAIFGKNGLFASDGLTGQAAGKLQDHICEVGVSAAAAGVAGGTGGSTGAALAIAVPLAIKECKEL